MKLADYLVEVQNFIKDYLENMGAEDGDTVILDDFEFEYVR